MVKPFSEKLLASCPTLRVDLAQRAKFLKKLEGKGGIYIFQYKYDPLVYYVGTTSQPPPPQGGGVDLDLILNKKQKTNFMFLVI